MEILLVEESGKVPVSVLKLKGELDAASYRDLIAKAQKLYDNGARNLILDLTDLEYISSAGLAALHIVSRLFMGEQASDEDGWESFKAIDRERENGKQVSVKLFNPSENIDSVLDTVGFKKFFDVFTDRDEAIQSFG
jgi:anti-anti-sigma regulatory factor